MQNSFKKWIERGLSQSSLSLYRQCPYAFRLSYLSKQEPIFWDPTVLDVGKLVHDAIDLYYKNDYLTEGSADDILYYSYSYLKKSWDVSLKVEDLLKAHTCLDNHSRWEHKNTLSEFNTKPLTEQKISQDGYYGILDYIDLNNCKVIDWKTGKNAYVSYEYRMQAHVYKTLFEKEFNVKVKKFQFYFLYPNEFRTISFEKEKQKQVALETEKLKNDVVNSLSDGEFPKKPRTDNGCRNCDFVYYCKVLGDGDD